ncbi:MAG: hypothetical protein CMC19_02195 [Flavobacteriaceae bacterium]|nr:hypothetical protein [Flavobacteriaceae bacterium]OUX40214.1 MAG: hypothetical protein CBE25_01020 [Flavobacteriaceae bacterium TMED265]
MKKRIYELVIGVLCSFQLLSAQVVENKKPARFKMHRVLQSETIYGISKKYDIETTELILFNDFLNSEVLDVNMILRIPVFEEKESVSPVVSIPSGFINYKVKKKENIDAIALKFSVNKEDILKYNPRAARKKLKRKQLLKIPVFKEKSASQSEIQVSYDTYQVKQGDTRWSIAYGYQISLDSLARLNPQLPENSSSLSVGDVLSVPSNSLEIKEFEYANQQEYTESTIEEEEETVFVYDDSFLFYEVQPKETIYGIVKSLDIDMISLYRLNPKIKEGLSSGMILKIPKPLGFSRTVRQGFISPEFSLLDSIQVGSSHHLLFMLPFRLDRVDSLDAQMAQKEIEKRTDMKTSLSFYSGALMAIDSLRSYGVFVNHETFDTELDKGRVGAYLQLTELSKFDAVIGPLRSGIIEEISRSTSLASIPFVFPLSTPIKDANSDNVLFSITDPSEIRKEMIAQLLRVKEEESVLIITDISEDGQAKRDLQLAFPGAKVTEITDESSLDLQEFKLNQIDSTRVNWVFLETSKPSLASGVTSVLNSINSEENRIIQLFTTKYATRVFESQSISFEHLSNLKFVYPSVYNTPESESEFSKRYLNRFGFFPNAYAARGFDLVFDLVLRMAYDKDVLTSTSVIDEKEYTHSKFNYSLSQNQRGYINHSFYLMQYTNLERNKIDENYLRNNLPRWTQDSINPLEIGVGDPQ